MLQTIFFVKCVRQTGNLSVRRRGGIDGKADTIRSDKTERLSSGIGCGATDSCDILATFPQLIKLLTKPRRKNIVKNMLLIVHAVSRQLTTGSLPTQLVLAVWGTDVQTDLLSFCRAEAHCYMWPNSTFVLDRKNVLLSSQVTISASTDRSTFRLMNAFVFWKSFNLLLFSQPFISDTLESMVFIKMDFIKVFLFVWFFLNLGVSWQQALSLGSEENLK